MPEVSGDTVHWVRVSWAGTRPVHLYVEIEPNAEPLVVKLRPLAF